MAVAANATLTDLNMNNNGLCGVNDFGQGTLNVEGLSKLADALKERTQLTCLDLGNNAIAGVNQRGMGVRSNAGIEALLVG